ncbi:hypothetical protein K0M31_003346 [Melipona bicolor]|uniref:Uncharacterized protein n=1 Tax=Melipona bicolor TaxID=60889 RepID=A0AA40KPG4_9HYME|nr:hypothetical protein K0M31_003346 [Melipona bicolor]
MKQNQQFKYREFRYRVGFEFQNYRSFKVLLKSFRRNPNGRPVDEIPEESGGREEEEEEKEEEAEGGRKNDAESMKEKERGERIVRNCKLSTRWTSVWSKGEIPRPVGRPME